MIILKKDEEIEILFQSNQIVATILKKLKDLAKIGISTYELDKFAEDLTYKMGARPAFKGYQGYPASLCASINDEVVHGIPSRERILKEGDLLSIDFGVLYKGFYGDSAITFGIGEIGSREMKLLKVTEESLYKGIDQAKPGNYLGDISYAVQSHVESNGFSVVREFVGHGIGRKLHEEPSIPNFGMPKTGPILKEGMTLAIEPMVNMGGWKTKVLDDKWTAVTYDGSLSAHFEHTIAIKNSGPRILSKRNSCA